MSVLPAEEVKGMTTGAMNSSRSTQGRGALLAIAGLTVLAAALRFWHLGDWSLDSDETFTLRDSLNPRLTNPRPLMYFLNHYLVLPFAPLDELGLRLLPALFGALAVPAFYFVVRRLVGSRAALFGALLIATSGLHVYYSQFARYWSLVFLLTTVYPYAVYIGVRDRHRGMLALGIVTGILALLAHPTAVLLLGGLAVWALTAYLQGGQLRRLWGNQRFRYGALVGLAVAAIVGARIFYFLRSWVYQHDTKQTTTEFLLHLPGRPGVKQVAYLLSFVESLTLPLVLTAAMGVYLLWRGRNRPLGVLLACMFLVPVAFLTLLSFRTPVSTFYLVPTLSVVFLGAGVFLDRLADLDWELRPRWLLSAALGLIIVATSAPTLISQYRDGRRYDFRSVALWLDERRAPEDIIYSDQPKVLEHYLPGTEVQALRGDAAPLARSVRDLETSRPGGALWVVSPAPAHAFRTNPKLGSLKGWIYENCQLRNTIGVGRVDFRQYHLQIYRCAAARAGDEAVANSE